MKKVKRVKKALEARSMEDLAKWMERGGHLPAPLKDFHDQKKLFQLMHARQVASKDPIAPLDANISWVAGQCYTIDRFLWFMARRGYTLQRSRCDLPFLDLQADIQAFTAQEAQAFQALLSQGAQAARPGKASQDTDHDAP